MKRGVITILFIAFILVASIGFVSAQEQTESVINNAGNYRVYAVVDSLGNVIPDAQGNLLESSWEFDVQ